ncbi:unnamed protein product [Closterium sp. NIES-53]
MHTPVPSWIGLFTLLSAALPAADAAAAVIGVRGGGGDSLSLPGVKHIVAVASAKGGVGKSTTAVNLAVALSRHMRLQVGLLDADVFGPSLPKLLGLATAGRPQLASPSPNARMLPLQAHGVLCMSMGFLMPADVAAVWRGPMVMAAVEKLVRGTEWGRLDVLVVDMPPGTGDVQLSMSQRVRLSGAVVVSTPQDLALMDARRGVTMFRQVNVPVLGVVENMSYFTCPACSHRSNIFSHGGARQAAADLAIEFLAEVGCWQRWVAGRGGLLAEATSSPSTTTPLPSPPTPPSLPTPLPSCHSLLLALDPLFLTLLCLPHAMCSCTHSHCHATSSLLTLPCAILPTSAPCASCDRLARSWSTCHAVASPVLSPNLPHFPPSHLCPFPPSPLSPPVPIFPFPFLPPFLPPFPPSFSPPSCLPPSPFSPSPLPPFPLFSPFPHSPSSPFPSSLNPLLPPFPLSQVPLLPSIRSRSDSGLPVALGASPAAASGRDGGAADSGAADSGAAAGGAAEGGAAEEGADAGSGGAEAAVVATYEGMARRVWEKLEEQAQVGGGVQGPTIVND